METNIITPENPLFIPSNPEPAEGKKPLDKKILILIILGATIFVLLILSIIVGSIRQKSTSNYTIPTPTSIPVTPTIEVKALPTQYQVIIDQIESELKTNLEFAPPQLDENIGL